MLFDIFALSFTTAKATQGSQGFWFIQETSGETCIDCTVIVNCIALSSKFRALNLFDNIKCTASVAYRTSPNSCG